MVKVMAGVVAVTTAATILVGSPAQAVNSCSEYQSIEFETPGYNTDMRVRLCLTHGSPTRGAYAQVSWENGGDSAADGRRKFDELLISYRLLAMNVPVTEGSCDLAERVNLAESGLFMCPAAYHRSLDRGAWGVDGALDYNIDRDGAGRKRVTLTPTPIVEN
ncbi:hypothetical protein Aco03nite_075050 [Actinoplanes couchii]|uniref:Ig-like domain-containing protein n=1 Tax=Actinoplanes couchii TaxID=403638 RepID=A0ABQ3XKS5_9ACTN|nr:hypothetical protein Aco03nite_075050 [Actinoplanes couchii]